jgi:hypothetical protein
MNDTSRQASSSASNVESDEETESIEESSEERSQMDVDFSTHSKSSQYRASKMLERGMTPFHNGRPSFLTVEEERILVGQLLNWTDMKTIPTVLELPDLVSSSICILFFTFSSSGIEDSRKEETHKISSSL